MEEEKKDEEVEVEEAEEDDNEGIVNNTCKHCNGKGRISDKESCEDCDGTGVAD